MGSSLELLDVGILKFDWLRVPASQYHLGLLVTPMLVTDVH